jgi:hypothetical protein
LDMPEQNAATASKDHFQGSRCTGGYIGESE